MGSLKKTPTTSTSTEMTKFEEKLKFKLERASLKHFQLTTLQDRSLM